MQANLLPEDDNGLPPPGQRWGAGAQSVLPYLTKTLQAKPAEAPHAREHRGAAEAAPSATPARTGH